MRLGSSRLDRMVVLSDENSRLTAVTTRTMSSSGQTVSDLGTPATHPSRSLDGMKHAGEVPNDVTRVDIFPNVI